MQHPTRRRSSFRTGIAAHIGLIIFALLVAVCFGVAIGVASLYLGATALALCLE